MKRIICLILTLASSVAACQQTTPKSGTAAQTAVAASAPSRPTTPDPAEFDKHMAQVQEHVTKMQEQMDQIQRTQDPQERQRLLQQHWATMRSGMESMREIAGATMGCCAGTAAAGSGPGGRMMGGPMMGGMMGWRGAHGYYSGLTPEQLRQRQYMTDRYVAMHAYSAETGHPLRGKLDRCSNANWTPVPRQTGHFGRGDAGVRLGFTPDGPSLSIGPAFSALNLLSN